MFHTRGGDVYAVQAECPHRGGPLADGLVGGTTLICPLHAWKFDLTTGQALFGDCGLKTYPVRVDDARADYSAPRLTVRYPPLYEALRSGTSEG